MGWRAVKWMKRSAVGVFWKGSSERASCLVASGAVGWRTRFARISSARGWRMLATARTRGAGDHRVGVERHRGQRVERAGVAQQAQVFDGLPANLEGGGLEGPQQRRAGRPDPARRWGSSAGQGSSSLALPIAVPFRTMGPAARTDRETPQSAATARRVIESMMPQRKRRPIFCVDPPRAYKSSQGCSTPRRGPIDMPQAATACTTLEEVDVECTHCGVRMSSHLGSGRQIRYFHCPSCSRWTTSVYSEVLRADSKMRGPPRRPGADPGHGLGEGSPGVVAAVPLRQRPVHAPWA